MVGKAWVATHPSNRSYGPGAACPDLKRTYGFWTGGVGWAALKQAGGSSYTRQRVRAAQGHAFPPPTPLLPLGGPPPIFPTLFTERVNPMKLTGDRNQCQGCKEYFNSTSAFDKHRTGQHGDDRRCLDADEMLSKGMAKNTAGFWVGSLMANPGSLYMAKTGDQDPGDTDVATDPENV